MEQRLGAVAIVVEGGKETALKVQNILSDFSSIILGRMGIPDKESHISVISVLIKGCLEDISHLTGRLGQIQGVSVKSALTSKSI